MHKVLPYESPPDRTREHSREEMRFLVTSLVVGCLAIIATAGVVYRVLSQTGSVSFTLSAFAIYGMITLVFCLPGIAQSMMNLVGAGPHKRLSAVVLAANLAPFVLLGLIMLRLL